MSSDSPTLVEDDSAAKKSKSNGSPSSNGTAVPRNIVRRKGVRKSNSGGQVPSGSTRQRGTERSKSDSSSTGGLTSRPNRHRVSKFSTTRGTLDNSARSTGTASSIDAESVGSYSLENDSSIDSKPLSNVKTTIARINKECTELDTPKSRPTPKRTGSRSSFGSRSSDKSERPVSPHSIGGSRSDQLDSQKSRIARRRSISRSSEVSERDTPSPHSTRGSRTDPLDTQKGRSAYRRSGSRSSGLSEREAAMGESRLDSQKSRSAPKRTSSRSSDVSERETATPPSKGESPRARGRKKGSRSSDASDRGNTASPPSLAESPFLRGRKKPASLRSVTDSLTSPSFTSPLVSARSKSKRSLKTDDASSVFSSPPVSIRSKSKKSLKTEDITDDASQRAERRKTRSKSKSRGSGKRRSSSRSRRRTGEGENGRRYRRSRTPSKDDPLVSDDEGDDSSIRRKSGPVSEDEIYQVLKSADGEEEAQRKAMRNKRLSKSPRRDQDDARSLKKSNSDTMRRPRSNSSGNMEGRMRAMRRASVDVSDSNIEKNREKKTRNPPRRTRSNNIGVDKSALDSFFHNSSAVSGGRRKKTASSSRSVVSGSKSLNVTGSGAKSVATTRSTKSRRRRTRDSNGGRPLKSLSTAGDLSSQGSFDEEDIFISSEYSTDDDDERSVDLDLATARDNFAQQNLNEKLQLHLTKTDELLYSVFPKHVADALRNGQKVAPENHDLVTIFFSDIVGFTDISAKLDPLKISDMLDRLYNSFDALSDYHEVFKVETIGDAYMAVTNLTKEQPDHCKRITEFAIDAIRVANQTLVDENDPSMGFVNIRVGFHSGSVVSNVVGTRNPRYCLFGDTVNTASRMESHSEKNRIHCSETSATLLREQCPRMRIFPRGSIEVKGKGEMKTFWVHMEGSLSARPKNQSTIRNFIQNAVRKR